MNSLTIVPALEVIYTTEATSIAKGIVSWASQDEAEGSLQRWYPMIILFNLLSKFNFLILRSEELLEECIQIVLAVIIIANVTNT